MQTPIFLNRSTPPKIITLVMMAGLSALTMNIFLPSLPGMAAYFDAPYALMQLSVALYLALSALLQMLIGPISDRYGRRVVVLGSLALFLLATLGTLLATTALWFLIFRMAQAVVAGCMVLSRAVVRDMVSDDEAASMIAYVTMGMSIVPMIGPVVGGYLDAAFGWHANFLAAVWFGAGGAGAVLGRSGRDGDAAQDQLCRADGELSQPVEIAEVLGILPGRRHFPRAAFSPISAAHPMSAMRFLGSTSKEIGLLFAITAVGYAVGNYLAGRFSRRLGMNRMVLIGTLLTTAGLGLLLLLTLAGLSGPVVFFGLQITMGMGNGIALPSANAGILSVRPEMAGTASGLGGAIQIGGGAALAAMAGALLPPGATELPLVVLMLSSAVAAVICILAVIRRARALGLGA